MFPLALTGFLAKRKSCISPPYKIIDTIYAVLKQQFNFDTVEIEYTTYSYSVNPMCPITMKNGIEPSDNPRVVSSERFFSIFDLGGRLIKKYRSGNNGICRRTFPTGVYFLKTNNEGPAVAHRYIRPR